MYGVDVERIDAGNPFIADSVPGMYGEAKGLTRFWFCRYAL
jgi:hypothetical protein